MALMVFLELWGPQAPLEEMDVLEMKEPLGDEGFLVDEVSSVPLELLGEMELTGGMGVMECRERWYPSR